MSITYDPCETVSRWDSITPVVDISRSQQGYIQLPVFAVTGLTWAGSSYIGVQFDFTLPANFSIPRLPVKPVGVNFILCIKWRVGTTVYRYKLWDHNDGLLYVPLYSGQRIGKNCVLECWTISSSTTISLTTPLTIYTSLLHAYVTRHISCPTPPSLEDATYDTACAGVSLFTPFPLPLPLPFSSCLYWLDNSYP